MKFVVYKFLDTIYLLNTQLRHEGFVDSKYIVRTSKCIELSVHDEVLMKRNIDESKKVFIYIKVSFEIQCIHLLLFSVKYLFSIVICN